MSPGIESYHLQCENKQNDVEIPAQELELEDEIDSSEELEEKKRKTKEFHVEGNSGQSQFFIQDIGKGGLTVNYYMQKMRPIVSELPIKKQYNLEKVEECVAFVSDFKNSEYFTTALVLCILEVVLQSDIQELKTKIAQHIPEKTKYTDEGKIIPALDVDPYVSLTSLLTVITAKASVTEEGEKCISLGKDSKKALNNMLEQFPALQETVIDFLVQITQEVKYHTAFYDEQIAGTIANMLSTRLINSGNKLFSSLYSNPLNTRLLGILLFDLSGNKNTEGISAQISIQMLSVGDWSWKAICIACIMHGENNGKNIFEIQTKKILRQKINDPQKDDMLFLSVFLVFSKYLRSMLCHVLYESYKEAILYAKKKKLVQTYIYLVKNSYYKINHCAIELPFVACDTIKQQKELSEILEMLMSDNRMKKQMYAILRAYLKELSQYSVSESIIKHIAAFFSNLSLAGLEYRYDIIDFLTECHTKAAKQVLALLMNTYEKEKGNKGHE